jgi:membrane-associated phospholipid phosphatase
MTPALIVALAVAAPSPYRVSWPVDGGVTAALVLAQPLPRLIPAGSAQPWTSQLLPIDERVKANFSAAAAHRSDMLAMMTVALPLAVQLGAGWGEQLGQASLVYAQAITGTLLLTDTVKRLVRRPRPYVSSDDPAVQAFVEREGDDAYLSFFSGHSSMCFAAAVASGYLFGLRSPSKEARAVVWGAQLSLASATANLRVLAGRHFYSDVIAGALVGTGVALGVVRLHDRAGYRPSGLEWGAMGAGLAAGVVATQLASYPRSVVVPLQEASAIVPVPMVFEHGAGLGLAMAL